MKMLSGVLSGLLIGAAVVFAALAVLAIVATGNTEVAKPPAAWALRLDVPASRIGDALPSGPVAVASGSYTVTSVSVTERGAVLAMGNWTRAGGLRLDNVGLELSLDVRGGALSIRPSRLWFGRLPIDLSWVSDQFWSVLLAGADAQANSMLSEGLVASGLEACGTSGNGGYISLYLCDRPSSGG